MPTKDTTEHIYAGIDPDIIKSIPQRIHKRIAMKPLGLSLREVRSVDELIIVAADVMKAHQAILRRCDILHRDLSPYNMLMTRDSDGMVHGMLIDFDCAVWASDEDSQPRANMTGTLPFMSIANLEELEIKRTSLDDWESLIYILCWLGTFGINDYDKENADADRELLIKEWAENSVAMSAKKKRGHMASGTFATMVSEFLKLDGYEFLQNLVEDLHEFVFDNKRFKISVEEQTKGFLDEHMDKEILDPFARRAEFEKDISNDLLNVMSEAKQHALEKICLQKLKI
ncbi:hypothetical protein FB639_001804 [Coemansia asiatica]|nr:hypothetical protein FB639_001804 [Coemansia asiatica]